MSFKKKYDAITKEINELHAQDNDILQKIGSKKQEQKNLVFDLLIEKKFFENSQWDTDFWPETKEWFLYLNKKECKTFKKIIKLIGGVASDNIININNIIMTFYYDEINIRGQEEDLLKFIQISKIKLNKNFIEEKMVSLKREEQYLEDCLNKIKTAQT